MKGAPDAMTIHPLSSDLKSAELPLSSIYLDPNNPRFLGPDSKLVRTRDIDKESVQERVRQRLIRAFKIEELRLSIEDNGYLPLDHVVVKEFKPGRYVVLEGNRRICAAKLIDKYRDDGTAVPDDVMRSLIRIPCLIYKGRERDAAWILQGIRHLSGVLDWPPYNKAKLFVEQIEKEGLSYVELGRKFATPPTSVRVWTFSYYAFKQAQESPEYQGVVNVAEFNYFHELFSRSNRALRNWMGWDDQKLEFKNTARFNEYIGWVYPNARPVGRGRTRQKTDDRPLPDAVTTRVLSDLIRDDPKAFEQFRRERDIDKARSTAKMRRGSKKGKTTVDSLNGALDTIRACTRLLKNNPYRLATDEKERASVGKELHSLKKALDAIFAEGGQDEPPIVRH
jgi:hypothetical protein